MEYSIQTITDEDREEFTRHLKGPDAYAALWQIQDEIRTKWKYTEENNQVSWWEVYQFVLDIIEDNGINLDEEYT